MSVGCDVMTAIRRVATIAHVQRMLGCGMRSREALELCCYFRRLQHHGDVHGADDVKDFAPGALPRWGFASWRFASLALWSASERSQSRFA